VGKGVHTDQITRQPSEVITIPPYRRVEMRSGVCAKSTYTVALLMPRREVRVGIPGLIPCQL